MIDDSRNRLLAAAAEILASDGYEALSAAAVAQAADLPPAIFDEHFVDTDDLCLVLLGEVGRAQVAALDERDSSGGALDLPRRAANHLGFVADEHALLDLDAELRRFGERNDTARYSLTLIERRTLDVVTRRRAPNASQVCGAAG